MLPDEIKGMSTVFVDVPDTVNVLSSFAFQLIPLEEPDEMLPIGIKFFPATISFVGSTVCTPDGTNTSGAVSPSTSMTIPDQSTLTPCSTMTYARISSNPSAGTSPLSEAFPLTATILETYEPDLYAYNSKDTLGSVLLTAMVTLSPGERLPMVEGIGARADAVPVTLMTPDSTDTVMPFFDAFISGHRFSIVRPFTCTLRGSAGYASVA